MKYPCPNVHFVFSESPRETNSKDSPASQADSGVFSIASSASPSKVFFQRENKQTPTKHKLKG